SVRPGRLKASREPDARGELHLELVSTAGVPLWTGVLPDPTIRRYEYEDPASPGALKVKSVQLTEIEFMVRAPFHKDATQLRVHRLGKPASRAEFLTSPAIKNWNGSIALPGT